MSDRELANKNVNTAIVGGPSRTPGYLSLVIRPARGGPEPLMRLRETGQPVDSDHSSTYRIIVFTNRQPLCRIQNQEPKLQDRQCMVHECCHYTEVTAWSATDGKQKGEKRKTTSPLL